MPDSPIPASRAGRDRPGRWAYAAWLGMLLAGGVARAEDAPDGGRIYRERCASCHGAAGEGTPKTTRKLTGDRSVDQLAGVIAETMPEDDPGSCTGPNAAAVAAYIHGAFYSPTARARNEPARVGLARLTVRQQRNAVADLIGSFRAAPWGETPGQQGLRGAYYKSRRIQDNERVFERVDPQVRFDFKTATPAPQGFEPDQFSIRWEGGILSQEGGEYEFIVRTQHSMRLWLNDLRHPLIDASVKSGGDEEYRATLDLLPGRIYPVKLEFSKAKQGVDDSQDKKARPPTAPASIALEWKPPGRVAEPIPARALRPAHFPEGFVPVTPFPPDDRSTGFERGTAVSKAWDQATTEAALEVAGYVVARLPELAGAKEGDGDRAAKLREFCGRFVEGAFRRPLTDEQKHLYIEKQFAAAGDRLDLAVKRVVILALKSPRFLYREAGNAAADPYDVASRIAFGLGDAPPDAALRQAAASGQLATRAQVVAQAERLLGDPRSRAKLREFFLRWLKVEQAPDLAKDPGRFPGFDAAIASDLRTSLDLFLEDLAWGPDPDYRRLFLARNVFLNGRLARFYGADLPPDAPFQEYDLEPTERAGVLTHPYLMATFAYNAESSPIHRGVFLARSVLGRSLRPPPEAFAPLAPELHAGMTTRERVTLQTRPAACVTCHGMINPLGFGLEHFDAVGRFRAEDAGRPVDARGAYDPPAGSAAPYEGARGLAALLAEGDEPRDAFVTHLFHHVVKQPIRAYGDRGLPDLSRAFAARGYNLRGLLVEIVAASALPAAPPTATASAP